MDSVILFETRIKMAPQKQLNITKNGASTTSRHHSTTNQGVEQQKGASLKPCPDKTQRDKGKK